MVEQEQGKLNTKRGLEPLPEMLAHNVSEVGNAYAEVPPGETIERDGAGSRPC